MITSVQNPRVKLAKKLVDRRGRKQTDLFLIEGYRELERAHVGGISINTLLVAPEFFLGSNEEKLIEKIVATGAEVCETTPGIFQSLSYRDRPDGLLAIATQFHRGLDSLIVSPQPFYVIAVSIEKPGNLGSILRSADGVGADAVIVCDQCTDVFNPNVVRSSVGTLFTLPVIEATTQETLRWMRSRGIQMVAATPEASQEYTRADFKNSLAIVVGSEQYGLTPEWRNEADVRVSIPMKGMADSLNVATATTLILYEVLRQRA